MPELVETIGQVVKGKLDLHPDAIRQLHAAIKPWEGKQVRVTVRLGRGRRTDRQNRFLFGVAYALLSDHTGYSVEEIHELMKALHLPKSMALADGHGEVIGEFVIGGTTTRLSTTEFEEYVDRIRAWSLDKLGVVIPLPNET